MKPILFNTQMVKALLDNRKTQTRRVIKNYSVIPEHISEIERMVLIDNVSKYVKGDILYVRETFHETYGKIPTIFKADLNENIIHDYVWKPSIHMPKEHARIFLRVTDVRFERLQDITWDDAKAEGVKAILDYSDVHPEIGMPASDYFTPFENLWNSTSKDGYHWGDNPYVFVYEFERVEV